MAGDTPLCTAKVALATSGALDTRHLRVQLFRSDADPVVVQPYLRGAAPEINVGQFAEFGDSGPVTVDVELVVDLDGRWVIRASTGTRSVEWSGHASDLTPSAAGELRPLIEADGFPLIGRVRAGDIYGESLGVAARGTITRPITDATAYGDLITAVPGEPCRGVVMAADTDVDAPPSPRPTSLAVTVTPRWLGVPS